MGKYIIFIINGSGGVGKDEFINLVSANKYKLLGTCDYDCNEYSSKNGKLYIQKLEVGNYSSVNKVKDIARIIGWNGEKTERDRKFLSDLKLLTTEYNDMPLKDMKSYASRFFTKNNYENKILFLHIREPEEIEKAINEFKKIGHTVSTILIKRDSVKHITSNMADENVYNYDYDIVINNNGTLEELRSKAKYFLEDFYDGCLKKEY